MAPFLLPKPLRDAANVRVWLRFANRLRKEHPDWWNAPVPAFGDPDAWLAIVGLAPGKEGANKTGRPFTGDASGETLFATLEKFRFLKGTFQNHPEDGAQRWKGQSY